MGVEGSVETERLRANVKEALKQLKLKANIEHITRLEDFMKFKINGIPALIIDETVVFQRHVPSIDDISVFLRAFQQSGSKPFGLKKILVPTDFSSASKGAYIFAQNLATIQNGEIKIINVHLPEYDPNNPYIRKPLESLVTSTVERLDKFTMNGDPDIKTPHPEVERVVSIGFPVEEIVRQSITEHFDLIIMGTTGEKGFLEKLFGSVSTSVAQRAKCPVMMVPDKVQFKGFKRILYAFDYDSTNENTIRKLLDIAGLFKSEVHFIHVTEEEASRDFDIMKKRLEDIFQKDEPNFPCCISKIEGHSVVNSLNDYANKNRIDLIVLVRPQRSFWENIFHRSITKSMTLNTNIPILVLKD